MSVGGFKETPFLEDDNPFLSAHSKPGPSRPPTSRTRSSSISSITEGENRLASTSRNHGAECKEPADFGHYHYSDGAPTRTSVSAMQSKHAYAPTTPSLLSPGASRDTDIPQPRKSDQSSHRSRSSRSDGVSYQNVGPEALKQARRELKAWEANFKSTNQRDATQDDSAKEPIMGM